MFYIILEHVSFNIMFCIKSDVINRCGFDDIDCIYMDKWALHGHFYSYVDPVWSLYNIETSCHEITQVVFWEELHNPWSWEAGTQWSGVGIPDIHKFSTG